MPTLNDSDLAPGNRLSVGSGKGGLDAKWMYVNIENGPADCGWSMCIATADGDGSSLANFAHKESD